MSRLDWLDLFQEPLDFVGFVLFLLVFPIYHGIYPWLMTLFPDRAVKTRVDLYRRSWIERLVREEDILLAAQQTRNLTMVNTLLASSALILMGFTANVLIQAPRFALDLPAAPEALTAHPAAQPLKLLLLIIVFGSAFAYCMTSLRHLGHFNVVIGADRHVIERYEGSAIDYLSALINRASNRYTMAVRCLYSASPLFLWLFDNRLFVGVTVFWALKFIGFQDFAFGLARKLRLVPGSPPAHERRPGAAAGASSPGERPDRDQPEGRPAVEAARLRQRSRLADD
ncbi:MAG TPA: DUF599 domain-containing protein [Thermoanaerobaculia bacterium]|nr:DUF599 domain-containing protein [Thermoanaerobaculia bacterium]